MNDAEYIAAIAEFYKDGPGPEFRAHYERLMHISAALAAPAQAATAKQSPHPEYDKGFSDGWNRCEERQAAAPAHAARAAQAEPEDLSVAYFMGLHAAKRAPQPPAQAQDARQPLTDAQFGEVVSDAHVAYCLYKFATFERALVHFTERTHGITAQQGDAA